MTRGGGENGKRSTCFSIGKKRETVIPSVWKKKVAEAKRGRERNMIRVRGGVASEKAVKGSNFSPAGGEVRNVLKNGKRTDGNPNGMEGARSRALWIQEGRFWGKKEE